MPKQYELYNKFTNEVDFVGTHDECQNELGKYGGGWAAMDIRENIDNSDENVLFEASDRAYKFLFAMGYFTTPTDEARIVENLLIQARVQSLDLVNNYQKLKDSLESMNQAYDSIEKELSAYRKQTIQLKDSNRGLLAALEAISDRAQKAIIQR